MSNLLYLMTMHTYIHRLVRVVLPALPSMNLTIVITINTDRSSTIIRRKTSTGSHSESTQENRPSTPTCLILRSRLRVIFGFLVASVIVLADVSSFAVMHRRLTDTVCHKTTTACGRAL